MTPELNPTLHKQLSTLTQTIDADSIVYWSYEENENILLARFCPATPSMQGFRQPLDRGLISQSFVTGLPLLENQIKTHHSHDPTFDKASGKNCQSLMAVPVIHQEEFQGVLSAATFEAEETKTELSRADFDSLVDAAQTLFAKS